MVVLENQRQGSLDLFQGPKFGSVIPGYSMTQGRMHLGAGEMSIHRGRDRSNNPDPGTNSEPVERAVTTRL